jgi:DUF1680 family protein
MKKIVLRDVPADVQRLIEARCASGNCSPAAAVLEILKDAAIEAAVQHDVALLESWQQEEDDEERSQERAPQARHGCGNVGHLVVCCHGSLRFS